MSFNMVATHARWPLANDPIFEIAGKAKEAIAKHGNENVIDATLGALYDDNGDLICLESVFSTLNSLPASKISAYAPLEGTAGFRNAVIKACFADYAPKAYIEAIATPGGTGAIKHAICNYVENNETLLVPDWHWAPYGTIAEEIGKKLEIFTLFDDKGGFNIESFKEKFSELIAKQNSLLTILNTPAQNPTGYSIADEEWDEILAYLNEVSKDKSKKIIVLVDTAYIDFAGKTDERRKFFAKFADLPENIFVMVAFSMSKGYTMYGMRSGAAIGISSNKDIVTEFFYSCMHSGRANWSNGTRGAMEVMAEIYEDPAKTEAYFTEIKQTKEMLQERANIFVLEAEKVGLETLPYRDGFFITIEHPDTAKLTEELTKQNLFLVPLKKGVRFAICAVSKEKCGRAPAIIKKAIEAIK